MPRADKLLRGALAVAVAVLLVPVASAHAGVAKLVRDPGDARATPTESLDYAAAPGELNRLTVTGRVDRGLLLIDEAGIQPGRRCRRVAPGDPTRVRCRVPGFNVESATIAVGDGDDVVRVDLEIGVFARLDGGPGGDDLSTVGDLDGGEGNDVLAGAGSFEGGPGDDVMTGADTAGSPLALLGGDLFDESQPGNGSDTIRGGTGRGDYVDYSDRLGAVRVDLEGDRDDGEAGENDQVGADVESIVGGHGDDMLVGSQADNDLSGNGGTDTLTGFGGDDSLDADRLAVPRTHTADVLDAGAGADRLAGSDGPNVLLPGEGSDIVQGFGGADRIAALDLFADRIGCGKGPDEVEADRRDFFPGECERIQREGRGSAVPLSATTYDGEGPVVEVGCPIDGTRRCVGVVSIVREGRRVGRRGFDVKRGRVGRVYFRGRRNRLSYKTVRLVARMRGPAGQVSSVEIETLVGAEG